MCWLSAAVLMSVVVGCGGSPDQYEGAKRASIKGKVTFDGAPVEGGIISFQGLDNSETQRKSGGPIVNGEYEILEAKGPNAGKYRVEILWPKPTGQKSKDPDSGQEIDVKRNVIPDRYNSASTLAEEVKAGENVFNFDLTSK